VQDPDSGAAGSGAQRQHRGKKRPETRQDNRGEPSAKGIASGNTGAERPLSNEGAGAAEVKRSKRRRRRKAKKATALAPILVTVQPPVPVEPVKVSSASVPRRPDLYAALDLGTNNCRLLIATPTKPGQFRVVDAFSRIVRLGEGLTASGYLSDAAMNRAVEALKICAEKLRSRSVRKARLIATEACRAAANGEAFLARVKTETGLDLEIVDRETEARLAVSGCGPLVNSQTDALVLFDIGGGSSEIALIDRTKRRTPRLSDQIIAWTSLPVGVVSLAERFGGKHVSAEVYTAMVDDVLSMIAKFDRRDALGDLAQGERFHLLGTSGTVTTLAGIHLGLERYDRRRVDGLWMEDADVSAMSERLQSWSFEERVANACIGAERADLVLAGCAILDGIRLTWPSQRLRVADRGLREGLLTEMMSSDFAWRRSYQPPRHNNGPQS
jgi:exopolyphosphatase / guanosine-5'-triphosphate,3'-diphosphate pyrophosphatase